MPPRSLWPQNLVRRGVAESITSVFLADVERKAAGGDRQLPQHRADDRCFKPEGLVAACGTTRAGNANSTDPGSRPGGGAMALRPVGGGEYGLPNRLCAGHIEGSCLEALAGRSSDQAEVPYGANRRSRIDLLLEPPRRRLIPGDLSGSEEHHLGSQGDLALFPDTVTERGQKI